MTPLPTLRTRGVPAVHHAASLGELLVALRSDAEPVREAAWAACYARFYDVVCSHASDVLRSMPWLAEPREVAADVASDVFAALPIAVRHYREEGRAGWWLQQLTVRTALRQKETARAAPLDACEPEELLELDRRRAALRVSADAQLRRWGAFLDLYVAGYEFAEIGARLGLTAGTARNWLCRIRRHLAQPHVARQSAAA